MTDRCPVPHDTPRQEEPLRVVRISGLVNSIRFLRDPFALLARAPERGDLIQSSMFGMPTVMLTHPALVAEQLREARGTWIKDRLSQRAADVFGSGLLLSEGDVWKRQRRLLNPGFANARFESYADTMRECTAATVARWPKQGPIDALAEMSRLTLDVAVRTLFGASISEDSARRVGESFSAVSSFYSSPLALLPFELPKWLPIPMLRRHNRAIKELNAVVDEIIRARRSSSDEGDDLLSMMLAVRDEEGGLSDRELRDQAITFLLAGHETTALGLTFALFELGRSPALRARLLAEVDAASPEAEMEAFPFASNVFEESLRLYPPAYALYRENVRDVTLGGVHLKKGTIVITAPWTLHRDARWHPEPLVFNPDRWTPEYTKVLPIGAYLPFGLGPRKCIGTRFAMLEAVLLLAGIARSHDWKNLDSELPPLQPSITCRPTKPVRLEVQARQC